MKVSVVAVALVAVAACVVGTFGCPVFRKVEITPLITGPFTPPIRQFQTSPGVSKCLNNERQCTYVIPQTNFYEIDFEGMNYPPGALDKCVVAMGFKLQKDLAAFEVTVEPHKLNLTSVEIVQVQMILYDIVQGVPLKKIKNMEFSASETGTAYMQSVYSGPSMDFVQAFTSTISEENGFSIERDVAITNLVDQVPFVAVSYLAKYLPVSTATLEPLTIQECGQFDGQLILECARPGWFDPGAKILLSEFLDERSQLVASPVAFAIGQLNDAETGPFTESNGTAAEWMDINTRSAGSCVEDIDCYQGFNGNLTQLSFKTRGLYFKCDKFQVPRRCVMCDARNTTSNMCDLVSQSNGTFSTLGVCISAVGGSRLDSSSYQSMCQFFDKPIAEAFPGYKTDRPANQRTCSTPCKRTFCLDGFCRDCLTDDNCILHYQSEYTASCDQADFTCSYTVPDFVLAAAPAPDDSGTVVIIAGAVAGGLCCIGIILGLIFFKMRSNRLDEADNTLSDTLSKKSRNRSDRFSFSD